MSLFELFGFCFEFCIFWILVGLSSLLLLFSGFGFFIFIFCCCLVLCGCVHACGGRFACGCFFLVLSSSSASELSLYLKEGGCESQPFDRSCQPKRIN